MSRRSKRALVATPPVWQGVPTIGALEKLAGVEDRVAFWLPFARYEPQSEAFDAGVAKLREMAERRAEGRLL